MGLLDGLMGNASEVDAGKVHVELAKVFGKGETVERAYQLVRDMIIFTNRRLLLVDRQGVTGSKVSYHSIPYRAITHFSVETAGHLDLEAELVIWISGSAEPVRQQFNRRLDIYEVQAVLAGFACK